MNIWLMGEWPGARSPGTYVAPVIITAVLLMPVRLLAMLGRRAARVGGRSGVVVAPHAVYVDHAPARLPLYNPEPRRSKSQFPRSSARSRFAGQLALFLRLGRRVDTVCCRVDQAFPKRMVIAHAASDGRLLARPPQGFPDGGTGRRS
jgi:hypothetical protein